MKTLALVVGVMGLVGGACVGQTVAPAKPAAPAAAKTGGVPDVVTFMVPSGACNVRVVDLTLHDAARNKDLEVRVRVPLAAPGQFAPKEGWPLVVFSHGAGGSRDTFPELMEFWASHGYASVAATHSDSIELKRRDGKVDLKELASAEGRSKLYSSVKLGERVADCKLIVDRLDEIAAAVRKEMGEKEAAKGEVKPPLFDAQRVAVAGHSAGAYTAQLCAGTKARGAGVGEKGLGFKSVGDARFKAAIVISGQGTTSRLLGDDSWKSVSIPMFVITGSLDASGPQMGNETPESRQHPYTKSRGTAAGGPAAYLMFIEGATHSSYAGKNASRLQPEKPTTDVKEIGAAVRAGTVTFLDAHVKGKEEALKVMKTDALGRTIPGKVRYEQK